MEKIILKKHRNGWMAFQQSNVNVWEFGMTKAQAVYSFMITLGLLVVEG